MQLPIKATHPTTPRILPSKLLLFQHFDSVTENFWNAGMSKLQKQTLERELLLALVAVNGNSSLGCCKCPAFFTSFPSELFLYVWSLWDDDFMKVSCSCHFYVTVPPRFSLFLYQWHNKQHCFLKVPHGHWLHRADGYHMCCACPRSLATHNFYYRKMLCDHEEQSLMESYLVSWCMRPPWQVVVSRRTRSGIPQQDELLFATFWWWKELTTQMWFKRMIQTNGWPFNPCHMTHGHCTFSHLEMGKLINIDQCRVSSALWKILRLWWSGADTHSTPKESDHLANNRRLGIAGGESSSERMKTKHISSVAYTVHNHWHNVLCVT